MKKKLEADLISIAHRILKLKNKSELIQLHQETQKLYEKLSVLRFVEENFGDIKPTIGLAEIEQKLEAAFEEKTEVNDVITDEIQPEPKTAVEIAEEEKVVAQSEMEETEIVETDKVEGTEEPAVEIEEEAQKTAITEEEKVEEEALVSASEENEKEEEPVVAEELSFKPAFELAFEAPVSQEKEEIKSSAPQITFEDLLGSSYVDPVFVKPEELAIEKEKQQADILSALQNYKATESKNDPFDHAEDDSRPATLNDRLSKGITIGLNDRVAFIKNLFGNSTEDYNRVLSQLITFDTMQEAQQFIEEMVKPDYNNWEGKDDYAQRFMEIIEKKFS